MALFVSLKKQAVFANTRKVGKSSLYGSHSAVSFMLSFHMQTFLKAASEKEILYPIDCLKYY